MEELRDKKDVRHIGERRIMVKGGSLLSITTLNVSGLHAPIKNRDWQNGF